MTGIERHYKVTYVQEVTKVLKSYYAHSLKPVPEDIEFIVAEWTKLFLASRIPSDKLMDLYMESRLNNTTTFFSIDNIISMWNSKKSERLQDNLEKEICTSCKGKRKILKYDFNQKIDVEVECPICVL